MQMTDDYIMLLVGSRVRTLFSRSQRSQVLKLLRVSEKDRSILCCVELSHPSSLCVLAVLSEANSAWPHLSLWTKPGQEQPGDLS